MRIVMVSNNYTPYSGGVVSSLNAVIPALHAAGHTVTLITLSFLDDHTDDPPWVVRVPHVAEFMYKKNHMSIPWRSDNFVLQEIAKLAPDIIHSQHPFLLGNSALKAAQKLKIPLVFTYHTMYEKYAHYLPFPEQLGAPVIEQLVQHYCAQVDGIIYPSRAIQDLVSVRNACTPCAVIPSGLLPVFIPARLSVQKKALGQVFKLLSVGRFVKEKNMLSLLDVYARLDQARFCFTLIGYGPEFEPTQRYAYEHLGLSPDRVRFMHKPEKTALAHEYRAADLFLFSSTTDTQGLVLAEAMAAGTPVIAFDGPGQRDIVHDGVNGFLVANLAQMREKIESVAQDPSLHARFCSGAHHTALAYYPPHTAARLASFYAQICRQSLG